MRLIIVRHGEPDYEHDSLTEKGWREAELLSKRLCETDVTAFYSSPLGRAEATSKPTLEKLGRTAEILPWLQEFPACRIDEKTGEAIFMWDILPEEWTAKKEYYDRDRWLEEKTVALGNGKAEYERVASGLDALLAKHGYVRDGELYRVERENRDTLVLFCHFGVEMVILSHLFGISPMILWHSFTALTSSVTTVYTEERKKGTAIFRCAGFGDISHLYAAGEPASFFARFCETYSSDERH